MTSERFSGVKTSAIGGMKPENLRTETQKSAISREFPEFAHLFYQTFWFSSRVLLAAAIERPYLSHERRKLRR
ncbi:MAG: hypothetical protein WCK77_10620 [Verrucomicrobiota bacterium]